MDQLVRDVGLMFQKSGDPATLNKWNRMSVNEKKAFSVHFYKKATAKNWRHLPTEIKLECIKLLDFNERLKLRMMARQERDIVDSLTIDFPSVTFYDCKATMYEGPGRYYPNPLVPGHVDVVYPMHTSKSTSSKRLKIFNDETYMSAIHFLAYALKIGKIEKLEILETFSPKRFDRCAKIFETSAPFRVKNLEIEAKKTAVLMILKNLEPSVDSILLDADWSSYFPFEEILQIPAVATCKLLKIKGLASAEHVTKLVEKWIEIDAPVGTTLQTSVGKCGPKFVKMFLDIFSDRILTHNWKRVRIGTNNAAKNVLLKGVRVERRFEEYDDFVLCTVIPSDFKDSDEDVDVSWTNCVKFSSRSSSKMWDEESERNRQLVPQVQSLLNSLIRLDILGIGRPRRRDEWDSD